MSARDPQIRRDPTQARLEPHTMAQLNKMKFSLQLIVFALVMGIVLFLAIVLRGLDGPWTFVGPDVQWYMIVVAAAALPPALIVPGIIRRRRAGLQAVIADILTGEPLHDEAIMAAARLQAATIVGCALFEGPAFANIIALMMSGDFIHLAVAGVSVIGVVCWFPTSPRYLAAIERSIENAQLDAPLDK